MRTARQVSSLVLFLCFYDRLQLAVQRVLSCSHIWVKTNHFLPAGQHAVDKTARAKSLTFFLFLFFFFFCDR